MATCPSCMKIAAAKAAEPTVAGLVSTDGAGFAPTDQGIYPGTGLHGLALGSFPSGLLILAPTTAEWQMGWYYGLC